MQDTDRQTDLVIEKEKAIEKQSLTMFKQNSSREMMKPKMMASAPTMYVTSALKLRT